MALLEATHEGLRGGQLFLWNEAARKVEALLGCPAAFDGEPFAQVSSLVSDTAVKQCTASRVLLLFEATAA